MTQYPISFFYFFILHNYIMSYAMLLLLIMLLTSDLCVVRQISEASGVMATRPCDKGKMMQEEDLLVTSRTLRVNRDRRKLRAEARVKL